MEDVLPRPLPGGPFPFMAGPIICRGGGGIDDNLGGAPPPGDWRGAASLLC